MGLAVGTECVLRVLKLGLVYVLRGSGGMKAYVLQVGMYLHLINGRDYFSILQKNVQSTFFFRLQTNEAADR